MMPVKILACALLVVHLPTTVLAFRKTITTDDLEEERESLRAVTLPIVALGQEQPGGPRSSGDETGPPRITDYLVDVTPLITASTLMEKAPEGDQAGVKCCCDVNTNQDWFSSGSKRTGRCLIAQSKEAKCSKMPSPEWAGGRTLRHFSNSESKRCAVHADDIKSLFETFGGSPPQYCRAITTGSASVKASPLGSEPQVDCKPGFAHPEISKCQYGTPSAGVLSSAPTCTWKPDWCAGSKEPNDDNGVVSFSGAAYGEESKVVCKLGYRIPLEIMVRIPEKVMFVCDKDGQFSRTPKCEPTPDFCAAVTSGSELGSSSSAQSIDRSVDGEVEKPYTVDFVGNAQVKSTTMYSIQVTDPAGDTWEIQKRFNDFLALHDKLRAANYGYLPSVPPKKYFGNTKPEFIAARQASLQKYMEANLRLSLLSELHGRPEEAFLNEHQRAMLSSILIDFLGGDKKGKEQTQEVPDVRGSVEFAALGQSRKVVCPHGFNPSQPDASVTCTVGENGVLPAPYPQESLMCIHDENWCSSLEIENGSVDSAAWGEYQDVVCAEGFQPSEASIR